MLDVPTNMTTDWESKTYGYIFGPRVAMFNRPIIAVKGINLRMVTG